MENLGFGPGDFAVIAVCLLAVAGGFAIAGRNLISWFLGAILALGGVTIALRRLEVISGGVIGLVQALVLIAISAPLVRSSGMLNKIVGALGIAAGVIVLLLAFPGIRSLGVDGTLGDILSAGWQAFVDFFTTANRA